MTTAPRFVRNGFISACILTAGMAGALGVVFGSAYLYRDGMPGVAGGSEYVDMIATAYAPFCCPGVDHITATGMRAGFGVVAVDPAVIPLGSRLYIEGYGQAVAGDVGGAIKGLRIDLGFDTTRDAMRWGRRPVRVFILEIVPRRRG